MPAITWTLSSPRGCRRRGTDFERIADLGVAHRRGVAEIGGESKEPERCQESADELTATRIASV